MQQILERGRTTKTTMEWTMRTVFLTGTSGRLQLAINDVKTNHHDNVFQEMFSCCT